jgi:hypothetical protein
MEEIVIRTPDKKEIRVKEADMKNEEIIIWYRGRKYLIKVTPKLALAMN